MESVAEDKHKAAVELVRRIRLSKSGGREYEQTLRELVVLCAAEVSSGLREGGGILAWNTQDHTNAAVRHVAFKGVHRALGAIEDGARPPNFPEYVRACVAEVVQETKAEQEKSLRELKPQQIYDMVSRLARPGAASVLDRLSFHQRNGLVKLIHGQLGHKGTRMWADREPEDHALWLVWYAFRLHMEEPAAKKMLREDQDTPTGLMIDLSDELSPQPKNSRGEPINLAGPLLVKVFDVLTGLPNNRIPAPARSNTKLGITFGVDPGVIARWKDHPEWDELQVNIEPDGKGGVNYSFDLDALLRSARIVMGKKRGPTERLPDKKPS